MNKNELLANVADKLDLPKKDTELVIDTFLEEISNCLAQGDKAVLSGFGTFEVRQRVGREGVNPRTGERIVISEQKTAAFKIGKVLKDKLR